jgi:CubicO group peptidase (beta-lactamase class C family)
MPSPHLPEEQIAEIDQIFAPWDKSDSPGAALAVIKDGDIAYERGYGASNLEHGIPMTPDSIFHVASMSKQFTATCVALLAADGALSLDDDVRRHLPELPDYGPKITLRHMLHHTSGLRDHWGLQAMAGWRDDDLITGEDVLEIVRRQKALNFPPGTEHLYSNSGYSLMATIVKRVTGITLRQFAQERIFGPLGMTRTHFHDDHNEIVPGRTQAYQQRKDGTFRISNPVFDTVGTTSLHTTVRDFARWDRNVDRPTVGDAALMALLQTPGTLRHGTPIAYALGLWVSPYRGVTVVEHSGGDAGYRSHYLRVPAHGLSVVVLANIPEVRPPARARRVVDVCLAGDLTPLDPPSTHQLTVPELAARSGLYRNPRTGDLLRLSAVGGRLAIGFADPHPIMPLAPDRFLLDEHDPDSVLQFDDIGQAFTTRTPFHNPSDLPRYERIEPEHPTATALADYTGDFWSDELGAAWRFTVQDGQLVRQRRRFADDPFVPSGRDAFARDGLRIAFTRDARGYVDGLFASDVRVRNVRFERPRPPLSV